MKTDNELMSDVQAELDWDPRFDNRGIVVAAKDGVVTMAGYVSSFAEKWAAEKAVKRVGGVRGIANDVEVKPGAGAQRTDTEIAEAAVNALKSSVSVPASDIKVIVNEGCVTLEGKVTHWFQKRAAEAALRNLWGMRSIHNHLEMKTTVHAGDIRGKIHQSYKRHADLDADKVKVEVNDGTVKLTGQVSSWRERDDAVTAAWSAPGVMRVENLLSVQS